VTRTPSSSTGLEGRTGPPWCADRAPGENAGSRGGTSALSLGSHPDADFTAQYIVAENPTLFPGDTVDRFSNPTHPLVIQSVASLSGYKDGWQEPGVFPIDTEKRVMEVLYGATSATPFSDVDGAVTKPTTFSAGNGSPFMLASLAAKGSRLILAIGSHDTARPFSHAALYYKEAVAAGVPARLELSYRYGHGSSQNTQPDLETLLRRTANASHAAFASEQGVHQFKPLDEAALTGTPIAFQPMVLEMPLLCGSSQEHTYTVSGPPGTLFAVYSQEIVKSDWDMHNGTITGIGTPVVSIIDTLPTTSDPNEPYTSKVYTSPGGLSPNKVWRLTMTYIDGGGMQTIPPAGQGPDWGTAPPAAGSLWDQTAATWWRAAGQSTEGVQDATPIHGSYNRTQGLSSDDL